MYKHSKKNIKKAIKGMKGRKPLNPIGSCFDSSIHQLLNPDLNQECIKLKDVVLCHGIGTANMPGCEGNKMGHAWIEFTHYSGKKGAIDTTWGVVIEAEDYRRQIKAEYVVEYTPQEALSKWKQNVFSGPWDEKIKAIMPDRISLTNME